MTSTTTCRSSSSLQIVREATQNLNLGQASMCRPIVGGGESLVQLV